jgi:hypothetical protein
MKTESLKKKYEPRILALFTRMSQVLTDAGFVVDEPFEMTDQEYAWFMTAHRPGTTDKDNIVDAQFYIVESSVHEGSNEGIAFDLTFTEYGGRILGQFSPYNYTPRLWIPLKDKRGIEARFDMFENMDLSNLPELLESRP